MDYVARLELQLSLEVEIFTLEYLGRRDILAKVRRSNLAMCIRSLSCYFAMISLCSMLTSFQMTAAR